MELLKDALETHRRDSKHTALVKNLGDGHLYAHNPLYRNVRDLFLAFGGQYTAEDFCRYDILPLAALPALLKYNKIPYKNIYDSLEELENSSPGLFLFSELPIREVNHIHHESAHCIADRVQRVFGPEVKDEKHHTLNLMISEAYADTCDVLGNYFIDSRHHYWFYRMNTYENFFFSTPRFQELMKFSNDRIGLEKTFLLLFYSFVHSNFLKEAMTLKEFPRYESILLNDQNLTGAEKDKLVEFFNTSLPFGKGFIPTTKFYFRVLGVKTPFLELVDFDFLEMIMKDEKLQKVVRTLADISVNGLKSSLLSALR